MLESILQYMSQLDTAYLYLVLFFFAFIENVIPPSPSDVVVVVGASLIASTSMGFLPVLIITSFGSSLGFILMYYVGFYFSEHILRTERFKFISKESLEKADVWFAKYGYKIILLNRFLPGTRSIISFFSGVYELHLGKTFTSATVSAFAWNVLIIYIGMTVGNNVGAIDNFLTQYSYAVYSITALLIIIFGLRYFLKKRKLSGEN